MKKSIYLFLFVNAIIYSCTKEKNCHTGGLNIAFQGFDTLNTDTTTYDTITIKSYSPNSLFNEEIDTEKFALQNYKKSYTNIMNGKIYYSFNPQYGVLSSDKDWEISFNQKRYRINSIKEKKETQTLGIFPMCVRTCFNPVIEYMMNKEIYQNNDDNMIIIQK